jgi:predicted dehydrogenase
MIRIAIAGSGAVGKEHLRRVQLNPRTAVAIVADPDSSAAQSAGVPWCSSVEQAIEIAKPDAVILATPTNRHVKHTLLCLAEGLPVLVEKPVAESVHSAARLVESLERRLTPVLVGFHRRHSPALQAAARSVTSGALGKIVAIQATTLYCKPPAYFDVAWRRSAGGGGPIQINMAHDLDTCRWIGGEIAAVQAASSNSVRGFDVEDTAAVTLEFASGALGSIVVSDCAVSPRSWEHTSGENPFYPRVPDQDALFIAGTEGSLAVPTMSLWSQPDNARSWALPFNFSRVPYEAADPLSLQLEHFCDVVEGKAAPLVTVHDALRTLAVTIAIRDSARTRRRIELPAD